MRILNLTQHTATAAQSAAGVFEPTDHLKKAVRKELTFETLPDAQEIHLRARFLTSYAIAALAAGGYAKYAMVGGAPFLMPALERLLRAKGIVPLYAFSRRESVEQTLPDGSVKKINSFVHLGFVEGLEL